MQTIAEKELDREASSLQTATYNDQKLLISKLFNSIKEYNTGSILLRLVVIDSLYSTNAAYSYFSLEEMADKIYKLLGETEEGARQYFYDIACGIGTDEHRLFQEAFGIQKNLSEGSKQMSLLSKYAYYTLYSDKETREKYPLGFPIYDSLALEAYPTVCKMLGIEQWTGIDDNIEGYVQALNKVRELLFDGKGLFNGKYQQFDILDAYLWRMGKFNGGNLSLLLSRNDYKKFVKNLGLNANPVGKKDKFYEKDVDYKKRMIDEVSVEKGFHCHVDQKSGKPQFDFNAAVVELYTKEDFNPFKGISIEKYLCQLLSHWRKFNKAKDKPARYFRFQKNTDAQIAPKKAAVAISADEKMKVGQLVAEFKVAFGFVLRIYNGRSKADDGMSLQEVGLTQEINTTFDGKQTVGAFIELMAKVGLKVKVYTCDEWVAVLDGFTLEQAGKIKKNATKADMESIIACKRQDKNLQGYTIEVREDGGYTVKKDGVECDNTKTAMREIAGLIGLEYDASWTTRQFGSKLICFLNNK